MIFYFDNLNLSTSNLENLAKNGEVDFWLVAPGSPIKRTLAEMNISFNHIDNIDQPGIYWIDVRGDSHWWCGMLNDQGAPTTHILEEIPNNILELVRLKKIRIVIAADREGSPMLSNDWDCFLKTQTCMEKLKIPDKSEIILHVDYHVVHQNKTGNKKVIREL